MREWVQATKAILDSWQNGTRLEFRSDYTTHTLMTPAFDPGPNAHGVAKILVGALGPKVNQMAAEVTDGILVMSFNTERHMAQRTVTQSNAVSRQARGARRISTSTSRSWTPAAALMKSSRRRGPSATSSRSTARPRVPAGAGHRRVGHLRHELNALSKEGQRRQMGTMITDDMINTIAASGTPSTCARQVVERYVQRAERVSV